MFVLLFWRLVVGFGVEVEVEEAHSRWFYSILLLLLLFRGCINLTLSIEVNQSSRLVYLRAVYVLCMLIYASTFTAEYRINGTIPDARRNQPQDNDVMDRC